MEPTALLNASYLDIVFDRRNKAYGAYELRKNYDRRMRRSALLLFLGLSVPVCLSFTNRRSNIEPLSRSDTAVISFHDINPMQPPKPPMEYVEPPPPPATHHMSTHILTPPVMTPNDMVHPDELPQTPTANSTSGTTNTMGDSVGTSDPTSNSTSTAMTTSKPELSNTPFTWVEQMPEFPGDRDEYMKTHVRYPQAALAAGIQGRVVIGFVVNEDGSVSDAKIVRGVGGGCDEEALRMVAAMPKWKPARHNGVPVKVFFVLPVKFEIE